MIDPNFVIETQLKSQLSTDTVCLGDKVINLEVNRYSSDFTQKDILNAIEMAFKKAGKSLLITAPIF